MFAEPWIVREEQELEEFIENVIDVDLVEHTTRERQDSAWQVFAVTNLTFYIYKMIGLGKIGAATHLPDFITSHRGMLSLNKTRNGKLYDDQLCFFRCLAVHLDCHCGPKCRCTGASERTTRRLFQQYVEALPVAEQERTSSSTFEGVSLDDMMMCEKIFDVSIVVLSLFCAEKEDGTKSLESYVKWSSPVKRQKKIYLNLHKAHFSYIKRMDLFCKAYDCDMCNGEFYIFIQHYVPLYPHLITYIVIDHL